MVNTLNKSSNAGKNVREEGADSNEISQIQEVKWPLFIVQNRQWLRYDIDEKWLHREYIINDRSAKDIAKELHVSPPTVISVINRRGLQKDPEVMELLRILPEVIEKRINRYIYTRDQIKKEYHLSDGQMRKLLALLRKRSGMIKRGRKKLWGRKIAEDNEQEEEEEREDTPYREFHAFEEVEEKEEEEEDE